MNLSPNLVNILRQIKEHHALPFFKEESPHKQDPFWIPHKSKSPPDLMLLKSSAPQLKIAPKGPFSVEIGLFVYVRFNFGTFFFNQGQKTQEI